jgi:DNA-binding protein HU-beta
VTKTSSLLELRGFATTVFPCFIVTVGDKKERWPLKLKRKETHMSKAEFVTKLSEAGKIAKKQADEIFSAFVGMIAASLQKGERVALPGLGVFSVVDRKAKIGRNPRTGVEIKIPARKAVRFSASSVLSTGLNGPKKPPAKAAKKAPVKKPTEKTESL